MLAACRGGGNDGKDDESSGGSSTTALVTAPAKQIVPDLSSLGYNLVDEFSQPIKVPGQDNFRRAFAQSANSNHIALVDVTVHSTIEAARTAYAQAAQQWGNPPPGVFGGIQGFDETPSPAVGDEQQSYVSTNADDTGNRAWTDVYRSGNVVFVVQLLDRGDSDQLELRKKLAGAVVAQIP